MNRKKSLLAFVFSEVVLPMVILALSVTFAAQFLALTSRAPSLGDMGSAAPEAKTPAIADAPSWRHGEALPPIARR